MMAAMKNPQSGIFSLGTASHAYLEFDVNQPSRGAELVQAVSSLREPRTTIGGVNLVAGFRPELWRAAGPSEAPAGIQGFNHDLVGTDGFTMPATQHDAVLWLSGSAYDVIFDVAHAAIAALEGLASVKVSDRGSAVVNPVADSFSRIRERDPKILIGRDGVPETIICN
jgi:putative iron-dependent peroxidase